MVVYDPENGGGVSAPFFEYALFSGWMDKTHLNLDRLWFDGRKVVGFVFNEEPVTDVYFNMTGGGDPFYEKTGYGKGIHWYCYARHQ